MAHFVTGQNVSTTNNKTYDWHNSGQRQFEFPQDTINVLTYGADNLGINSSDESIRAAMDEAYGRSAVIFFPPGNYLFHSVINIPDSVVISGSGSESTVFNFDLGGTGHLINIEGKTGKQIDLMVTAHQGDSILIVEDARDLHTGDFIRIEQNDESYIHDSWAKRSTAQTSQIVAIDENKIKISNTLNLNYSLENAARIIEIKPKMNAGICCLKIIRIDQTEKQYSNIRFRDAYNGFVTGVESEQCNFAHVEISKSAHVTISGNYFHHGFSYGGGGRAYGVVTQLAASNNLVENNIFVHLRHSILVQAGASSNVFAYNYSTDPFWENGFVPSDAAGDIVLHGNYPYLNLFEGNIVQNVIIDDVHNINGHGNTLFRNRIENFGLVMLNNPPSNHQHIIANEITNLTTLKGLFIINGEGHQVHGNVVKQELTSTSILEPGIHSMFLDKIPDYFSTATWPPIGNPELYNQLSIPARDRYLSGKSFTVCRANERLITSIAEKNEQKFKFSLYPNPTVDQFTITSKGKSSIPLTIKIFNGQGKLIYQQVRDWKDNIILDTQLVPGIYIIHISQNNHSIFQDKLLVK